MKMINDEMFGFDIKKPFVVFEIEKKNAFEMHTNGNEIEVKKLKKFRSTRNMYCAV